MHECRERKDAQERPTNEIMFYREAGQFKATYVADQAMFPIVQDRWFIAVVLGLAYLVVPFVASEYWLQAAQSDYCSSVVELGHDLCLTTND